MEKNFKGERHLHNYCTRLIESARSKFNLGHHLTWKCLPGLIAYRHCRGNFFTDKTWLEIIFIFFSFNTSCLTMRSNTQKLLKLFKVSFISHIYCITHKVWWVQKAFESFLQSIIFCKISHSQTINVRKTVKFV